jgi:hypothetical protein
MRMYHGTSKSTNMWTLDGGAQRFEAVTSDSLPTCMYSLP